MGKELIDDIDRKILKMLSENSHTPYAEIGDVACIAAATVHQRIKKLEKAGIIKKSKIEIDYTKIGYDIKCFLGIYLDKSDIYDNVLKQLNKIPEIVQIDYTTGNYSMFICMYCRDTTHLREVLHDRIQKIEGISRTETIISLSEDVSRELQF